MVLNPTQYAGLVYPQRLGRGQWTSRPELEWFRIDPVGTNHRAKPAELMMIFIRWLKLWRRWPL